MFGEIAFFTEVPQLEGVRACSVARVLTVPRNAYNGTAEAFPLGARSLLENLRIRAQQVRQLRVPGICQPARTSWKTSQLVWMCLLIMLACALCHTGFQTCLS